MTDPAVFGNDGIAKFLFETGNTEYKELWSPTYMTGTYPYSFHESSASTDNGADYIVPASHLFWMLGLTSVFNSSIVKLNIASNTSPDTSSGGTTLWKSYLPSTVGWQNGTTIPVCLKFTAGQYITPWNEDPNDIYIRAWGIETDA